MAQYKPILRWDLNPPRQSQVCYQTSPLPPSHHGWVNTELIKLTIKRQQNPMKCCPPKTSNGMPCQAIYVPNNNHWKKRLAKTCNHSQITISMCFTQVRVKSSNNMLKDLINTLSSLHWSILGLFCIIFIQ